jgi:hypothetical protein
MTPWDEHGARCYIYAIQSGQFIKIGLARNLKRRLYAMRLHNPHELRLMAHRVIPVRWAHRIERCAHRLLAEQTIGREWFACTAEQAREAISFSIAAARNLDRREAIAPENAKWNEK